MRQHRITDDRAGVDAVFAALGDEKCRCILAAIEDEAMTVKEISDCCDVSPSTAYRKVDKLRQASLVERHTKLTNRGKHPDEFVPCVERIRIDIAGAGDGSGADDDSTGRARGERSTGAQSAPSHGYPDDHESPDR
ncbi:MAG: helix-turn-helix domain-containing protein [Haloarculaceae archaeon]